MTDAQLCIEFEVTLASRDLDLDLIAAGRCELVRFRQVLRLIRLARLLRTGGASCVRV